MMRNSTLGMLVLGVFSLIGCTTKEEPANRSGASQESAADWILDSGQFRNRTSHRVEPVPSSLPENISALEDVDGPDGTELYTYILLGSDTVGVYLWSTARRLERLRILSSRVHTPSGGHVGLTATALAEKVGELEVITTEEGVLVWGTRDREFSFVLGAGTQPRDSSVLRSQGFVASDTVQMILWSRNRVARQRK